MSSTLDVRRLFPLSYADALALQLELVRERAAGRIDDTLLLTVHEPVFTTGRGVTPESLPQNNSTPVVEITRGGDITWHGPGQLVGYWIRDLKGPERDLHAHLRLIEDTLIEATAVFGLKAGRNPGFTGVWAGEKKIASIGVAVRQWVTFHGFALNVSVDPEVYKSFRPCGLGGDVMCDLNTLLDASLSIDEVADVVGHAFGALYR